MSTARPIPTFPGLLSIERDGRASYARLHPACGWVTEQRIHEWRNQIHVVAKAALTAPVKAALAILLPEEQVPPATHALRALRSTAFVEVSSALALALGAHGIRVWTIGFHRNPALFRVAADGGDDPFCLDRSIDFTPEAPDHAPRGRPAHVPWPGRHVDGDCIDWLLRALSGGVLDEPSVLLARAIGRSWPLLRGDDDHRRAVHAAAVAIRDDPYAAEGCYAHLQYEGPVADWEAWVGTSGSSPGAETLATAHAMAAPDGPSEVVLAGGGVFFREQLDELPVELKAIDAAGWLPPLPRAVTRGPALATVALPGVVRYVAAPRP